MGAMRGRAHGLGSRPIIPILHPSYCAVVCGNSAPLDLKHTWYCTGKSSRHVQWHSLIHAAGWLTKCVHGDERIPVISAAAAADDDGSRVPQMLATLAADPIAGLVDTAYMGRLGEWLEHVRSWFSPVG